MEPCQLTATEAAALIRDRKLSAEELVRSCLARIDARDPAVRAWLFIDRDMVIRNARELDKLAPVGDRAEDAAAWPALGGEGHHRYGGSADDAQLADLSGRADQPGCRLRQRGAVLGGVILGKTDTVEFASGGRKALSRNPFNPAHTPGGSSSGSGAAVGDFHVPLAFGTQTGGSHIRPGGVQRHLRDQAELGDGLARGRADVVDDAWTRSAGTAAASMT